MNTVALGRCRGEFGRKRGGGGDDWPTAAAERAEEKLESKRGSSRGAMGALWNECTA